MKRWIFLTLIVSVVAFGNAEAQKKKSKKQKSTTTETTQPAAATVAQPTSVTMNASLANDNSLKEKTIYQCFYYLSFLYNLSLFSLLIYLF